MINCFKKAILSFLLIVVSACFWFTKSAYADNSKLFGTIEFRAAMDKIPAWLSVLDKQSKSAFFPEGAKWRGSYQEFKNKYKSLEGDINAQLSLVNLYWNQYPYREDIHNVYKTEDYWAIPDEMVKNSGDCEDYSIAKYYTLKDLGFPPDKMRVVVVFETIRNIAHAVLAVYLDDDVLILDNLSNRVFSHTLLKNYDPRFSINEQWRWVHMKPKKKN